MTLQDKTVMVTGATGLLGAATLRLLMQQGRMKLRACARDREKVGMFADDPVQTSVGDITDRDAVLAAVADFGPVDVLVANAGNGGAEDMLPKRFVETVPEDWQGPMEVNLLGVLHCCHAVLPGMVERGHGRIIAISSAAGTQGVGIGFAPYSVGKGGALSLVRSLALEHGRDGITANSVALGVMDSVREETVAAFRKVIPVGRLGTPDDVAAACLWLASDEASWVTGQTIGLNGGAFTS